MNDLAKRIEAILFIHGEPITIDRLVKILGVDKIKVRQAAEELDHRLIDTALTLVWRGDALQLATRPALAKDIINRFRDPLKREDKKFYYNVSQRTHDNVDHPTHQVWKLHEDILNSIDDKPQERHAELVDSLVKRRLVTREQLSDH